MVAARAVVCDSFRQIRTTPRTRQWQTITTQWQEQMVSVSTNQIFHYTRHITLKRVSSPRHYTLLHTTIFEKVLKR